MEKVVIKFYVMCEVFGKGKGFIVIFKIFKGICIFFEVFLFQVLFVEICFDVLEVFIVLEFYYLIKDQKCVYVFLCNLYSKELGVRFIFGIVKINVFFFGIYELEGGLFFEMFCMNYFCWFNIYYNWNNKIEWLIIYVLRDI